MNLSKVLEKVVSLDSTLGGEATRIVELALKLADTLPELREKIAAASDPWSLYALVRDGIGDETIATAFGEIGAEDLYTDLKALAEDFDGKLPDEMEILLRQLGHYEERATGTNAARQRWSTGQDDGLIAWDTSGKLLSVSQDHGSVTAAAAISGNLGAAFEAGSLWFYADDKVSAKGLVRIGLSGELEATASGSVPFGTVGSASAEAAAGAGAQVHLFWRRPVDHIVARALADIVRQPINVFSLEEMLAACRGPAGFEGLIMAINGYASLDIDLAVARDIDVEGLFSATAGLTISIGLARKAAYELSVRKVSDGLRLVLSHADEDARKWGVGLGIDIDATQVARKVGAVVQDAVEHWDKVLEDVKPFLSPGTWLQENAGVQLNKLLDKLDDAVGDNSVTDALRNDLRLVMGLDGDGDKGLSRLLSDKALDAVSSLEGMVIGNAKELSKEAVAELAMRLPAAASAQIKTKLEAEIEALIKKYQGELKDVTNELAKTQADKVSKALGKLGTDVSAGAAKLDDRAKKLRNLVDDTDKLVQKIAAAVQDAALAKISARLRFEKGRLGNEQFEVAGTFTDVTSEASALFHALMMGRLGGLGAIFDPTKPAIPGFSPEPDMCSVRRFSKVSKSLGYEIVLLGMDLTGKGETSGSADIEVGLDGKITVKTVAIAKRAAASWDTSRKADFLQTGSMLVAKAEGGQRPAELKTAFAIDLSSQRQDKHLTAKEVKNFLALMRQSGLIDEARIGVAVAFLTKALGNRGGGKLPGVIAVEMRLSEAEVSRLAKLGEGITGRAEDARSAQARLLVDAALDALQDTGEWGRDEFEWFVDKYVSGSNTYDRDAPDPMREKYFANLDNVKHSSRRPGPRGPRNPDKVEFDKSRDRHEAVLELVSLAAKIAEMQAATPSRKRDGDGTKWGLADYRAAGSAIADSANDWIGLNQWGIFFFGKGMDQRTVALMLALARLTRVSGGDWMTKYDYNALFEIALVLDGEEAQGF